MRLLKLGQRILKRLHREYRTRLWYLSRRFGTKVTMSTKQGIYTLPVRVDDPISRSLFINQSYELDLIADVMAFVRKRQGRSKGTGTIVDIGANCGVISIGMLVTGELDRAIAIEPDPRNFSVLKQNVKQNQLESAFMCLNYALSDKQSILQFELSESNYGDHRIRKAPSSTELQDRFGESTRKVIEVQADTLDNLIADIPPDFSKDTSVIWIDVQGYEGYVFLGAKNLLAQDIPVVAEIWPYAIQRTGMSQESFCAIAQELWSSYWVERKAKYVQYPINVLYTYFDELGDDGAFGHAIFTK